MRRDAAKVQLCVGQKKDHYRSMQLSRLARESVRKPNPGTHQECRSLLQKAVRRGDEVLTRAMAHHLYEIDEVWLRSRTAVIVFEECWPLAPHLDLRGSCASLIDTLARVATAPKIKDAAGLGSLAYALSQGDQSVLTGSIEDSAIRTIAAAIERPQDFWRWIEQPQLDTVQHAIVESARRSHCRGGWPWDRAFMQAAAYLAVTYGVPSSQLAPPQTVEVPFWAAIDKHTARGKEVLRIVAKQTRLPWRQVFWSSFYFESAVVNDDESGIWWRREVDWRLARVGLSLEQAKMLWETLRPRVMELLADEGALLRQHVESSSQRIVQSSLAAQESSTESENSLPVMTAMSQGDSVETVADSIDFNESDNHRQPELLSLDAEVSQTSLEDRIRSDGANRPRSARVRRSSRRRTQAKLPGF